MTRLGFSAHNRDMSTNTYIKPAKQAQRDAAKHMRARLRHEGIKASVRQLYSCGAYVIRVDPVAFDVTFTHDEQQRIGLIAQALHVTYVRGLPIDTTHDVKGCGFVFEMPEVD